MTSICPLSDPAGSDPRLRRVLQYMTSHLVEGVSLRDLARVAEMGPCHLIRVFRAQTGRTPYAYFTRLRVEEARRLIVEGRPLADVALQVGFYDQSHLTRHFARELGDSPARYRRRQRSLPGRPPDPPLEPPLRSP